MKKLRIPKNPNHGTWDRRMAIQIRAAVGLGGAAMCGSSVYIRRTHEVLSMSRDVASLTLFIGATTTFLALIPELIERYRKPHSDEDDDGHWGWQDPDFPSLPDAPGGNGVTLSDEIELFLTQQELTSV